MRKRKPYSSSAMPLCRETVEHLLNVEKLSFAKVAEFFGCSYFDAYLFAKNQGIKVLVPKSGRRISPEIKAEAERLLTTTNMTIFEIQQRLGLSSRHSIYLIRDRLNREQLRQAVNEEAGYGLTFVDARQHSELRRCPEHGKVSVWPCVICAAQQHRQQAKANRQLLFTVGSH